MANSWPQLPHNPYRKTPECVLVLDRSWSYPAVLAATLLLLFTHVPEGWKAQPDPLLRMLLTLLLRLHERTARQARAPLQGQPKVQTAL